ncbi:hypothetical protein OEZ85_004166 [Tetradesmus obliquus]|uniref:Mitochondrial import inner membrane translocase subunit TIM50 n=1 Tax=Tetradesmus obliquus TaxID=3088 RepID=A0ABY8UNC2_TETOB|nr:hypothetical protein OEZ85_004166 [Tetradesmus obliquus]
MSVPRFVTDMPIPLAAVEISSNASAPLLKLQQLQLSTAALLLGLWQLLQGLTIALLASLVAKTAAAKSSLKENARCSLLLLKHASRSTTGHIATWLRIHIRSSSSRGAARTCRSKELSSFAEVVLFTAASAAYAAPLAHLLDPQRRLFAARLYGDACVAAGGRAGVKDLSGLGRALGRVVLVDNSPYSFLLQPANGLPCLPFHGQRGDGQLLGVILPLLRSLAQLGGDIRPLLEAKFRVRGWLASKGVAPPPEQGDELWG